MVELACGGAVNSRTSYLSEAAFFLHVLLDGLPNATLSQEGAPGGQLKLLVAAISLQGYLHDAHRLQERKELLMSFPSGLIISITNNTPRRSKMTNWRTHPLGFSRLDR